MLPSAISVTVERLMERCVRLVTTNPDCRVCLIGTYRTYFGDQRAEAVESSLAGRFRKAAPGRCSVLRTGEIVSSGPPTHRQRLRAPLYPLMHESFRNCFIGEAEVLAAACGMTQSSWKGDATIALLGCNRAVADVWREQASCGILAQIVASFAMILRRLGVAHLARLLFAVLISRQSPLRRHVCTTLEPESVAEMLSLINPWNRQYVVIAGYNTGVDHFGWRYPNQTVVKTIGSARLVRVRETLVDVDAGITIKRCVAELARYGRELYVVPNYSYVSLGTAFFVPIHGSGSGVSTLGDTIEKALAYDTRADRLRVLRRGTPEFARAMYAADSGLLVLRLRLRIRPQSRFFMKQEVVEAPSADDVWKIFVDGDAANIEVRKRAAADSVVQVSRFYPSAANDPELLEVPRDSIGRIWDRLEENPLTSYLFHALTKRFAYHVELFLDRREFELFWNAHASLPLLKLQLRFARRDDMPNSPIGERDCVSVDLFMRRSAAPAFLEFLKENLPHARFNRGKHSK